MAIINSMGIGRARKSMGNVTYRTVRGRTVGSQKRGAVGGAATRGEGLVLSKQQALFGMTSMYMQAHADDIEVSFNKSKYGSQRNYFVRKNKTALFDALSTLATTAMTAGYPLMSDIEEAITAYATEHPTAIYRVSLQGFAPVFLTGAWDSADNPISGGGSSSVLGTGTVVSSPGESDYKAPAAVTSTFRAGARIVRPAGTTTIAINGIPSGVTVSDIVFLTTDATPVTGLQVTEVTTTAAGNLVYESPAVTESQNVLAVQIKDVFVRLTSAYTTTGGGLG